MTIKNCCYVLLWLFLSIPLLAEEFPKPYSSPCVERKNVFEFTAKPKVKNLGNDRYEISFSVKDYCDVTVGIVDERGKVVRHIGSGVLGPNAPAPFQKGSLNQVIYWNGKDDLDVYVKEPEKLKVRVMLGLKPTFEKLLADAGPKNLPGYVWGIAIDENAAYVFAKGEGYGQVTVRKFDRNGNYLGTIFPPPATVPHERLQGMGYVEYEPGKRALQGRDIYQSVAVRGFFMPNGIEGGRRTVIDCQPVLIGNRIYFANPGSVHGVDESLLHYIYTDGSTDITGLKGLTLLGKKKAHWQELPHYSPRLASSPDGKYIYMTDAESTDPRVSFYVVWRKDLTGPGEATPFIGTLRKPGSDNASFGRPTGIDCDSQGRLYVCDMSNNRVQIFSSEGKFLKTITIERPYLIRVHRKTGSIYILNIGREEGRSTNFLTKIFSFDDTRVVYQHKIHGYSIFALDSWSSNPRLWLAGGQMSVGYEIKAEGPSVQIYEEEGNQLKLICDFDEEARKAGGSGYIGRWGGTGHGGSGIHGKLVCDPVRERVYYGNRIFDLQSGAFLGTFSIRGGTFDDFAFDKYGRMHIHFNPGFFMPGVGRVNPDAAVESTDPRTGIKTFLYPEMPYDYGEEKGSGNTKWTGILPVKDQPGAKFFQDGIGVNMRGDIAIESNIYYVPKMEEGGFLMAVAGMDERGRREEAHTGDYSYEKFMQEIKEKEKRGEEVFFIRRQPGIPLCGATIWVYDRSGQLRGSGTSPAATVGSLVNGVRIDEDGNLYFVMNRSKIFNGKPFLADRTGRFGEEGIQHLMSGTLVKTAPKDVRILLANASVPLDQTPSRPPEVMTMGFYNVYGKNQWAWVEGAEWLYGGASPIVQDAACSCPTQRFHLDWYKRSFVPEAYRHSIGVVDTAGNLIMHIGQYGNYDSGFGPKSKIRVGGDDIAMIQPRFISGTDNHLVFTDWCERIVVLKLEYHAVEEASIPSVRE
jgi:DNA-binding beta-propeller fold protein YncE